MMVKSSGYPALNLMPVESQNARKVHRLTSSRQGQTLFDVKVALQPNKLQGIWRLMSGHRRRYLIASLALGLAALLKTATYLLLRYFIDEVLVLEDGSASLVLIALGFVGLAIFEGAFTYVSGRLAAKTAEGIALRLRLYLFDHLQRLPFEYHDQMQTGELISRVTSDVDALRRFFADQAIGFGRVTLLFIVNLTALLALDVRLALFSIIAVPLIVIVSLIFFRKVTNIYEGYQQQEAVLSSTLQENLTGVRVVRAFARQQHEIENFEVENQEKYRRGRHFFTMHSLFWPLSDIVLGAQMLAGLYLASMMTINGDITLGTYLAYAGILIWIIWPMRNLGRLIVQMSMGLVSFSRVMEIVSAERERLYDGLERLDGKLEGAIEFDQVCFKYEEEEDPVLEAISFRCHPGQTIALLGSTGSGKTSLVNLLPRFYDYTAGKITLDGRELKDYSPALLRSHIGIVEQEPFLFSRTVEQNITYGLEGEVPHQEVVKAAQAAAIHQVIESFPDGYQTLVGEKGVTLSGGQKQRIAIARTLLKDPKILILDDATSSVDTETEGQIRAALDRLMQGRTSFIIAHRVQSVMNADLILVMDQGRIVQRGTHRELMQVDGLYSRIYKLQAQVELELEKDIASATD